MASDSSSSRKGIHTVKCLLCGGNQIYPGPRFENHLINEHGVVFEIDLIIKLSIQKDETGSPNKILECKINGNANGEAIENGNGFHSQKTSSFSKEVQTDMETLCRKCKTPIAQQNSESVKSEPNEVVKTETANVSQPNDVTSTIGVAAKIRRGATSFSAAALSNTFTCFFCNQKFCRDYKLKLHLMVAHKGETSGDMAKAHAVMKKSKLDGCIHRCAICQLKFNSVVSFSRHIKDSHAINRFQYREQYGNSEIVRRMLRCELCDKDIKHSRNIVNSHMKTVHDISWQKYQEILIMLSQGQDVGDVSASKKFNCIICGVTAKNKHDHLRKVHQLTEKIYSKVVKPLKLKESKVVEKVTELCIICERECLDLKMHLAKTHQLPEAFYNQMVASRQTPETPPAELDEQKVKIELPKKGVSSTSSKTQAASPAKKSDLSVAETGSSRASSPNNLVQAPLSTDLQCYFGCVESFKKDYQLNLHLKLHHNSEDPEELQKAYEAAQEEIALTRRSGSTYQCALCPKTFNDNGAFCGHIQSKHSLQWQKYKDKYGRCEVESAPFECKICSRVIKYDRNTVHTHLKNVHGISWTTYIDRIRRMRRGEELEELPVMETHVCLVCNVTVKYLRDHLRNVHKLDEQKYEKLYLEDKASQVKTSPSVTPIKSPPVAKSSGKFEEIAFDQPIPKPPKSDIDDKLNRRCSSCNITHISRRSFIEHCTIVHSMKFKTKSGVTISAPTLQERANKESLKRESEVINEQPVINKKPKTSMGFIIEMDNGEEDAGPIMQEETPAADAASQPTFSAQRKTIYTPAGVSKWNQCKYECVFCKWSTMSRSSMTSHLYNTHKTPIQEYKKMNYPDIEVETNWFQCRLCSARTKFVKDCIAPHLKMSHGMNMDTYEREVMQPEDWPYEVVPEPSLKSEIRVPNTKANIGKVTGSVISDSIVIPGQAVFQASPVLNTSADQGEPRDLWNRCRYQCSMCELITIDARQMRMHIPSKHDITYEDYVRVYGSIEIVTKKFQCAICGTETKFCRQNIYSHLKDVHKTTLADYKSNFGIPADDDSDNIAEDQFEEYHAPDGEAEQEGTWEIQETNSSFVDPSLLDDGRKPSRWNKCRFRCVLCGKLSGEKRHIREHIIKIHGMSLNDYEMQYGECEIHTEYFFCGVCHAEVKHNLKNISLHLQNVHSLTPQMYEEQHGPIPDDDVPIPELATANGEEFDASNDYTFEEGEVNEQVDDDIADQEADPGVDLMPLANPPRSEIVDPRNKYCSVCNRDFNRRQAFVEHCRTVHKLKVEFKKPGTNKTPVTAAAHEAEDQTATGGFACIHCGKVFSSRSNRTRHLALSCDYLKAQKKSGEAKVSTPKQQKSENSDAYADTPRHAVRTPVKCPYPDCDVVHLRTALLKRHLSDDHKIQTPLVKLTDLQEGINIKDEPSDEATESSMEHEHNGDSSLADNPTDDTSIDANSSDGEKKVPPLRVRIPGKLSSPEASPDPSQPPSVPSTSSSKLVCDLCNTFSSNNSYIMSRHKNACIKKQQKDESANDPDANDAIEVNVAFNDEDDVEAAAIAETE